MKKDGEKTCRFCGKPVKIIESGIYRKIVVDAEIVWVAADTDGEEYVRPDGSKVQALEISLDEPRGEWAYRPHRWTCK